MIDPVTGGTIMVFSSTAATAPTSGATGSRFRLLAAVLAGVLALTTGLGLVITPGLAPTAAAEPAPGPDADSPVSTDPLPTVQINGVVWAQVVIGNRVFVGGDFTRARPAGAAPGSQEVVRTDLLAYDLRTGVLDPSFAPSLNGEVLGLAASPDGSRLYVGGSFTTASGGTHNRIVAYDVASGAAIHSFAPNVDASVYGLAATETTLYAGGRFSVANGVSRPGAAAFDLTTGALKAFAPQATGGKVRAIIVSPDRTKVVIGGHFTKVNGSSNPGYGLAMVSATTGASLPLSINGYIRDGDSSSAITSLVAAGSSFYGSGYTFSRTTGTLEGAFRANWNGDLEWMEDCHGDTYSVFPTSTAVYIAGHPHYCGNIGGHPQTNPWTFQRGLAFSLDARGTISRESLGYTNFEGRPRPDLLHFFPYMNAGTYTGQNQGPWSVAGNDDYVTYAGEFTVVNSTAQQGIVRFARKALAPKADAPTPLSPLVPHVRALAGGRASISWPAVADRDDPVLNYRLVRNGVGAGIYSTTARSTWWRKPYMTYIDSGLVAGQTYTYQVRAADPTNARFGPLVSFTYNPGPALGSYDAAVLADGPKYYYHLDDSSTTTVVDAANGLNGTGTAGTTTRVPGAIAGSSGTAFRFNGSTVGTPTLEQSTNWFSVEAWFKTTSTRGGKIIGFGNSKTGSSSTYDRQVYLANDGRVFFGISPGTNRTVNSSPGFNNGQWHHVVATLGNDGQKLYVDGQLVGNSATNFAGANYEGYWRIGGDRLAGWPSSPTDSNLAGDIDEVAIYPTTLSASRIAAHNTIGRTGQTPNQAPTASFTATTNNLTVSTNGTQSTDSDGTVSSYAWTFGDGATATGATSSHTYASAGTYTVTLVVTDNDGAQSVAATRTVSVQATNQPPTASFTLSSNGLVVAADGSASSDPDGTIASYAWDFGDDSTGSGATPTHTYASSGTYVVKLTVTDNRGGTAIRSQAVTVPTGVAPFALDEFNRSVSGGWGSAEVGGPWTVSSTGAFSVSGGSGRMLLATAGVQRTSNLTGASEDSADVSMVTALDKPGTGGGTYLTVSGRRIDAVNDYRLTIKALSTNRVTVAVGALKGSATVVQFGNTVTLPGTYTAGDPINIRFQVTGTNPTTVRARVWLSGQAEPSGWTVSATDSYAGLQTAGHFGLTGYLSGSATNAPVTIEVRRLEITAVP